MVLGKLSVPGRPTYLDNSRIRAYCAYCMCELGFFGMFFFSLVYLSPFLWETARWRLLNGANENVNDFVLPPCDLVAHKAEDYILCGSL